MSQEQPDNEGFKLPTTIAKKILDCMQETFDTALITSGDPNLIRELAKIIGTPFTRNEIRILRIAGDSLIKNQFRSDVHPALKKTLTKLCQMDAYLESIERRNEKTEKEESDKKISGITEFARDDNEKFILDILSDGKSYTYMEMFEKAIQKGIDFPLTSLGRLGKDEIVIMYYTDGKQYYCINTILLPLKEQK